MMMPADDRIADGLLAQRARDGDRAALVALVERHYGFIYRVAYRLCGQRADAEDVAQDVCARLGKAVAGYRGGSAFTSWLYAIVANAARDLLRRNRREDARVAAFGMQGLTEAAVTQEADDPAEALWAAVRTLPDKQQEAVTLVYGEEMSHAQAAETMGVAEATVSWHIHEAKKRLKVIMGPAGEAAQ